MLTIEFGPGAGPESGPPRPSSTGLLAGTPVAVAGTGAGWLAVDAEGDVFASASTTSACAADGTARESAGRVSGLATTTDGRGCWLVTDTGSVAAHGTAARRGDVASLSLSAPIVGMAATPSGRGYWLGAADGGVFALGDAKFFGAATDVPGPAVVGIASRRDGRGYWLATTDGRVLPFGAAMYHGDASAQNLAAPLVAITATRSDRGYWLLGADGGVFAFGDARFFGAARNAGARAVGLVQSRDGYNVATWRPAQR